MLREGGTFVAKFFKSSDLSYLYVMMKQVFRNVYVVKPQSSRASSAEAFVVGLGFLGESAQFGALSDSIKTMKSPQAIGAGASALEEAKKDDKEEEKSEEDEDDKLTF